MPRLKAWGQGSGASAHRQLVQGPALNRLGESSEASIRNLVLVEPKHLHIAHQTKGMSQESVHAKSQGMGTRQPGASIPSICPAPPSHLGLE